MLAELRDCCADLLLAAESWSASPSGRVWRRVAKRPIRGKETGGGRLIAVLAARGGEVVSVGPEAAASCPARPLTSLHFVHAGGQYYVPMPGLSQRLRDAAQERRRARTCVTRWFWATWAGGPERVEGLRTQGVRLPRCAQVTALRAWRAAAGDDDPRSTD